MSVKCIKTSKVFIIIIIIYLYYKFFLANMEHVNKTFCPGLICLLHSDLAILKALCVRGMGGIGVRNPS